MLNIFYTIIIYPITQIIEFTFFLSQKLFNDNGVSVIFIGLTISTLTLPLYAEAEKWQVLERETQKKLKTKIDKIKKAFKGDHQYMILSTYYRQNHYHPIYALRSTFGLLIQIPFFMAAYSYISQLEVIKNAPFLFIADLGAPDAIFSIGGFSINILPIVMTLINCVAGAIYTKGFPARDKIQLYGMAAVFLLLLYNSPSALVLYWTINNIYSLVKNIYFNIKVKNKHFLLTGFFSFICFFIMIFCIARYSHNAKALQLSFVCFLSAVIPWLFMLFKDRLNDLIKIEYNPVRNFLSFFLPCLLVWSLFGLFIPSQLIASSPQEFSFIDDYRNPLFFIFNTALQILGLFVFWPVFLYFLFQKKVKKYFSVFFLALAIGMIVNAFMFSGNYGIISIDFVYNSSIRHSNRQILFNLCILIITVILSFILCMINKKRVIFTVIFIFIFSFLGTSFFNTIKINDEFSKMENYFTKQEDKSQDITPLFSLSRTGKNIVIIMLDRGASVFVPYIFEESPELKEKYTGFTFYPNTVSFNGYTRVASPPIYGGYEYTPEEMNKRVEISLVKKHNEALLMLPRIFSENGFLVTVTDPPYANYNQKSDLSIFDSYPGINALITDSKYTDIWIAENDLKLPKTSDLIKRNMLWYSVHKGLPLLFRQSIYMDGNWCYPVLAQDIRLTLNGYSVLYYMPKLTKITDEKKNTALIMTNNTTHENSFMQAPEYTPRINVTNYGKSRFSKERPYHINAAAIKRLADWFDFLKEENLYDNTKIILVADHGPEPNFVTKIGLPINVDQFNPLLMVKDFNSSGDIKTDMTFMSNADVPYLSLTGVIENPINPFTENPIMTDRKNEPLYIAVSGSIHIGAKDETQFILNADNDYLVYNNIFDAGSWSPARESK